MKIEITFKFPDWSGRNVSPYDVDEVNETIEYWADNYDLEEELYAKYSMNGVTYIADRVDSVNIPQLLEQINLINLDYFDDYEMVEVV